MRVMRVLTRPNLGGPTRQAIALWHAHRELQVPTLLVTGVVDGDEATLSPAAHGVPELSLSNALDAGEDAAGWVQVPALRRGLAPVQDLVAARTLRRLVAAFAPDVVHTHTSKAGWIGRRAARLRPAALVAHTFHGHVLQDYFGRALSSLLRWQERRAARGSDLLFAVSDSCADELAAARVAPRERFVVVPPAVPKVVLCTRSASRERLGLATGERRCVCIGRLVPIKRVAHFVRMIAAEPSWLGDVVGDGPERGSLEALAARLAPGRVRFRGAMPDIASLLPAYDALVLPSVREGCPLVAVEAFAAGVPVFGYDVPGVRDVLSTWGRGELVAPSLGPEGLAAALRGMLTTPDRTASQVEHNRAARARFDPGAVAAELLAHYRAHPRCRAPMAE